MKAGTHCSELAESLKYVIMESDYQGLDASVYIAMEKVAEWLDQRGLVAQVLAAEINSWIAESDDNA